MAADVRPQGHRQVALEAVEVRGLDHLLQCHQLSRLVGDLDPDRRLARDRRLNPNRRRQGHGQVGLVGKDLAHRDTRSRLELVLGHGRAGIDAHDLALNPEVAQGALDGPDPSADLIAEALSLAG